jgi:hypothetical protein
MAYLPDITRSKIKIHMSATAHARIDRDGNPIGEVKRFVC